MPASPWPCTLLHDLNGGDQGGGPGLQDLAIGQQASLDPRALGLQGPEHLLDDPAATMQASHAIRVPQDPAEMQPKRKQKMCANGGSEGEGEKATSARRIRFHLQPFRA